MPRGKINLPSPIPYPKGNVEKSTPSLKVNIDNSFYGFCPKRLGMMPLDRTAVFTNRTRHSPSQIHGRLRSSRFCYHCHRIIEIHNLIHASCTNWNIAVFHCLTMPSVHSPTLEPVLLAHRPVRNSPAHYKARQRASRLSSAPLRSPGSSMPVATVCRLHPAP